MEIPNALDELKTDLKRREYSPRTITIYCNWVERLKDFYPKKSLESLNQKDISEYLNHLNFRLNTAASSINQAFQSYQYLYNNLWNKGIDFSKIEKPDRKRSNPDILTTKEVLTIIEATNNIQHKLLLSLTYSAGLDKNEVKNLKLSDIDTNRNIIKIRDSKSRIKREAVLAKYVKNMLKQYLKENSLKKFVFENTYTNAQYSDSTIGRILANTATKAGISKKITFKTLKYSYVIHSYELGRPLKYTLDDLKMKSSFSLEFFNNIVLRSVPNKPFSPLDKIALTTDIEYPINIDYLEQSILRIKDKDEADYLKEALVCMNSGSLRAGIIFAWNAAILNLRKKCFELHGSKTLNAALKKHYPKAKEIKKIEDFAYIKDSLLLLASQELGDIDKGEKDALEDCLDLRNKCGHPGKYRPKPIKAGAFMEELLTIVFKKQNLNH